MEKLLTNHVAYLVETQEDYNDLMEKLEQLGCKWSGVDTKPTSKNEWNNYFEKTCIVVEDKNLFFSNIKYINRYHYEYQKIIYKAEHKNGKIILKKEQKFIADWYEKHKDEFEYYIYVLLSDYRLLSSKDFINEYGSQMLDWVGNSNNNVTRTLVKMDLFGYEIEDENSNYAIVEMDRDDSKKEFYIANVNNGKIFIDCDY